MKLSIGENRSIFKPYIINGARSLEHVITKKQFYSLSLYKNNKRERKNFLYSDAIGLDFDGDYSLEQAKKDFKDYKCVIATTRNHQKLKNGKVDDRFRVILFLTERVTSSTVYKNTINSLMKKFPHADPQCNDAARMFYPSVEVVMHNQEGKLIEPAAMHVELVVDHEASKQTIKDLDFKTIPAGFTKCKWAIANGFFEAGEGNQALMSLVSTCKKLGYTKEQAYYMAKNAIKQREARTGRKADKESLWREVVEQIYSDSWGGAVYVCSEKGKWLNNYCENLGENGCDKDALPRLNSMTSEELLNVEEKVEWVVDNLMYKKGTSIIAADPKAGKSTITRQLSLALTRGQKFLNRDCKQSKILYIALDENTALFKEQIERAGLSKEDNIYWSIRPDLSIDRFAQLKNEIEIIGADFVIIDTLHKFLKIEDSNKYDQSTDVMETVRDIADETDSHILFIHHTNKGEGSGPRRLMGSQGFYGAVDCLFIMERREGTGRRFISTSQRGGVPFNQRELIFDHDTLSYDLVPQGVGDGQF